MSTLELQQLRDDLSALRKFVDGIRPHVEQARAQSRVDRVTRGQTGTSSASTVFGRPPRLFRREGYPEIMTTLPAKTRRIGPYSRAFRNALGDQFDGRSREGRFLRKVQLGLLAQLGREPSFAESMPAFTQQRHAETHAA